MSLKIVKKEIFRKGIATQLSWSVSSYERNGSSVQVSWSLFNEDDEVIESDIITLGNEVVSDWSSSDSVIDDALLEKLGLQILNEKD
jgi:hypothetical protein